MFMRLGVERQKYPSLHLESLGEKLLSWNLWHRAMQIVLLDVDELNLSVELLEVGVKGLHL